MSLALPGLWVGLLFVASFPALEPLPTPRLEAFEPDVREVLESTRAELDRLVETSDADPETVRALGRAYGEAGQLYHAFGLESLAAVCYRNGARLDPDPRWTYLGALLALENRDLEAAVEGFRRVAAEVPDYLPARLRRAEALRLAGELGAAEDVFLEVVALPDAEAGAVGYARLGLGRIANARGEAERALRHLVAVLEQHPDAGAAAQQAALAYRRLGRTVEAREAVAEAGPGEPRFRDPWAEETRPARGATAQLQLGNAQLRLGNLDAALRHHREARRAAPGDPAASRALALTLERLGRLEEAVELYDEARRAEPEEGPYVYDWARAAWSAGADPVAVADALRGLVARAPDFLNAHLLLGAVALELGRVDEAEQSLKRALALSPGEPRALEALAGLRLVSARALWQQGRDAEAVERLQGVDGAAALDLLARVLATTQDSAVRDGRRAVAAARRAFELERSPAGAETMALALAAAGAFDEAMAWQERLLDQMQRLGAPEEDLARLRHNLERFRAGRLGEPPWRFSTPGPTPE